MSKRMPKVTALILSLVMVLCLAGYSSTTDQAQAKDAISGTFTGTGYGMQGEIIVSIEVKDGEITSVELVENSETPHVAKVALERIPEQIVEYQSLSMDAVTGATLASNGIIHAVEEAAENAGLDVAALYANTVPITTKEDQIWDTDVLVIGGGGAGFSAAIAAAQNGADVILIEKSSVLGGNTMVSGSAYNVVDAEAQSQMILTEAQKETLDGYLALDASAPELKFDIFPEWEEVLETLKDDINRFYLENSSKTPGVDMPGFDSEALHMWHIYTGGLRELNNGEWVASDLELARTLVTNALSTFEWMNELGLECVYGAENADNIYTVLGAMWPRTHNFISGEARISQLNAYAEQCGVTVYTETSGTELLLEDGKVVGAKAEQVDGTQITINTANGVILATGGYCANPAMVKEYDEYWGENLSDTTLSTNLGTNEGDGIIMAMDIGADVTGLEIAQMMPSSSPTKGTMTDGVWGDASEQIWIDAEGNRFVNEYAERDVLTLASMELEDGIFYIIYAGSGEEPLTGSSLDDGTVFGDQMSDLVESGQIWYGETLADLVEATKSPAAGATPAFTEEQLRATIETYNSYVESQKDDDFGKEVIAGAIDLDYIESTEGVGIFITPRKASLHHTMGGVVIDTEARVLDTNGDIIEGLWAAGEVTGGIHAGNRLGGNALADVFTMGRIAGQSAVVE